MALSESEENRGCFRMKIIEYHDIKTLLGPCFVSFSLPLFVPGVVLTVVGSYGNENSFPTFGGWHLVGIITLSIAVILLISGIILKCCYRPIISADIEQHLSPTASMITGSKNLGHNEDIFGSKSAQNSNKVGHRDINNSHTVVSTHDTKQKSNKDTKQHFLTNTAIAESQTKQQQQQQQQKNATSSQNNPSDDRKARGSNKAPHAPPNEKLYPESNRSDKSQTGANVVNITQGGVTTKVTATIKAEAETVQASGSRDQSSDATENSKFLPEKKKRKKKKRKSRENLDPDGIKKRISKESLDGSGSELSSSRRELPELRMRPSLIHEGSEHHHHDLHVHFQNSQVDSPNNSQDLQADNEKNDT